MRPFAAVLLACLLLLSGCAAGEQAAPESDAPAPQPADVLTLDRVTELAQKGEGLTWSDFSPYDGVDLGSGLHILKYEIDEHFVLYLSGGSLETPPAAVTLLSRADPDRRLDLRTAQPEDLAAFLAEGSCLKAPPDLTVLCGADSVQALEGGFSWRFRTGDGTETCLTADALHPLQAREETPTLSILPSAQSARDPLAASLSFAVAPDEVTVCCWSGDCWDNPAAESEALPVTRWEPEDSPFYAPVFTLTLKDEPCIYAVTATWSRCEPYGGTACYSFYAQPAPLSPVEIRP